MKQENKLLELHRDRAKEKGLLGKIKKTKFCDGNNWEDKNEENLGSHRTSSSVIGEYAWKHKYTKRQFGSTNGVEKVWILMNIY